MPKIIGLRYALLSIALATIIFIARKQLFSLKIKNYKTPLIILALLTFWIYFQAIFLSDYTAKALKEINGQWLVALLSGALGLFAAKFTNSKLKWIAILAAIFSIYVIYTDLFAIRVFLEPGRIQITKDFHLFYHYNDAGIPIRVSGLSDGMDKNNYITNIFFAFLAIDVFYRVTFKKRILPVDNFFIALAIVLTILSSYFQAVRNGALAFLTIGLGLSWLMLYYKKDSFTKSKLIFYALIVPLCCMIFAVVLTAKDKRWQSLIETIPLALDTQTNKAWINHEKYPFPKLNSGEEVSASNYERVAWIQEGLRFSLEKPLGYGYDRNAFGYILEQKYPQDRDGGGGHSHSAIVDFILGVGYVGLIIWLAFVVSIIASAVKQFRSNPQNFSSLLLIMLVTGFLFRSILDSNMRDHNLEEFFFLCGIMLGLSDEDSSS